jgi:hypothetical protein
VNFSKSFVGDRRPTANAFGAKRAGAAGFWKIRFSAPRPTKSNSESFREQGIQHLMLSHFIRHPTSGVLHIGNYFGMMRSG